MQKEKSIRRNILIVVLILVIIASVCSGLFAWAKYQTTINGTATGETAKWSFKVSDGDTSTQEIEFPMTRTDNNTSVAEGKIAPGTYGELEIGIDATGTETALTYVIEGELTDLPRNLKLYSNEEKTEELIVANRKFSKGGYMKLNEAGVRTETIYWEWPFETGTAENVIQKNDSIDMQDSEKTMSMKVSVTGKQVNGNPVLADLVQVGDFVNYDAGSASISTTGYNGATLNGSIAASQISSWRVLSKNPTTGEVQLIASNPTTTKIKLSGMDGYKNAIEALDTTCAIFKNEVYAEKARSLVLEDIMQYTNFNPKEYYTNKNSSTNTVGGTRQYTSGIFITGEKYEDENGEIKDVITGGTDNGDGTVTASESNPVTVIQTSWNTIDTETTKQLFSNEIYNMFFKTLAGNSKPTHLLASRCTTLGTSAATFRVHAVIKESNKIDGTSMYSSESGNTEAYNLSLCPVVHLKSSIKTTGQDENGVWQLNVN